MELYIRQKAFTGRFAVQDYLGNDRWHTKLGDLSFFFRWQELHVFDADGNSAAYLYRQPRERHKYFIELAEIDIDPPKPQHGPGKQLHDLVEQARHAYDPPLALVGIDQPLTLKDKLTYYSPKSYCLEGLSWRLGRNRNVYTLHVDGSEAMQITREEFTVLLSYRLDIADPRHELLCVCIALAVACMDAEERARAD